MPAPSTDMIIDIVDDQDRVIGTIPRRDVFARKANFRVVHVFLFNPLGELLLQQIAPEHDRHPGYWGSSAAGYMFAGESYDEAVRRKLKDELGVTTVDPTFESILPMLDEGCKKFIGFYTLRFGGTLQLDPSQASQARFFPLEELDRRRQPQAVPFTPTFLHLFDAFRAQTSPGQR